MTRRLDHQQLAASKQIVAAPPSPARACDDQTFELPPALHVAMAGLFIGFVSILCATFATPGLMVPYAIFVIFIVAFFGVPALWTRMKPQENRSRSLRWNEFAEKGIDTMTGRTPATEATVLVLLLPFLIMMWAVAVATIHALVR